MHEMTASYSEISFDPQETPSDSKNKALDRPDHLDLKANDQYVEDLDGTITREGDMVNFVAEDLEFKIKLASPIAKPLGEVASDSTLSLRDCTRPFWPLLQFLSPPFRWTFLPGITQLNPMSIPTNINT